MKVTVDVKLSIADLASEFAALNDEQQAQFFIEVAKISATWLRDGGLGPDWQWWLVGKHLKSCACSTEEARDMVRSIAEGVGT